MHESKPPPREDGSVGPKGYKPRPAVEAKYREFGRQTYLWLGAKAEAGVPTWLAIVLLILSVVLATMLLMRD